MTWDVMSFAAADNADGTPAKAPVRSRRLNCMRSRSRSHISRRARDTALGDFQYGARSQLLTASKSPGLPLSQESVDSACATAGICANGAPPSMMTRLSSGSCVTPSAAAAPSSQRAGFIACRISVARRSRFPGEPGSAIRMRTSGLRWTCDLHHSAMRSSSSNSSAAMTTVGTTASVAGTSWAGVASVRRRGGSVRKPPATACAAAGVSCGTRDATVAAPKERQRSSTASCTSANSAASVPGSSAKVACELLLSDASDSPSASLEPTPPIDSDGPTEADRRRCLAPPRMSIPNSAARALARRNASASAPRLTSSSSPVASAAH